MSPEEKSLTTRNVSVLYSRQLCLNRKILLTFKSVGTANQRCIGGGGHDLFRKGISHKKIPLSFAVAKNSRSALLNF